MRQTEWQGKTGGGNLGQRALTWFFRYVDVRVGYGILGVVVVFYMLFARRRCLAIYRYFRERWQYPVLKAWYKTYRNHYLFGQTVLDKFAVFSGNGKKYRVTMSGKEYFEQALNAEKGCIIASSHVGNFEISGYLLSQDKKKMHGIIFGGEAEVVQRLRLQVLGSHNVHLIPVTADMSHIFQIHAALTAHEIVSMPCDRVFSGNKVVELDFLGAKATFPAGAYYLAEQFGIGMLAFFVMKESALHYHIYVRPLEVADSITKREERVKAWASCYVKELEAILRFYPEQWYNFYSFWNANE